MTPERLDKANKLISKISEIEICINYLTDAEIMSISVDGKDDIIEVRNKKALELIVSQYHKELKSLKEEFKNL